MVAPPCLALEHESGLVCIDDAKARRAARAAGLRVTGSLGLLIRAKELALIPALRPFVERAQRGGIHYHPELVGRILEAVGEADTQPS